MCNLCVRRLAVVAVLIGVLAAVGCGSTPTSPTQADPTGTWVGTAGNGLGTTAFTLVLVRASNGYQGTIMEVAGNGNIAPNTPLRNVTWDGTTLAFILLMIDGTGISVTAQINGDTLTGTYQDSRNERGTILCSRQR